jgi:hypothetical protein
VKNGKSIKAILKEKQARKTPHPNPSNNETEAKDWTETKTAE